MSRSIHHWILVLLVCTPAVFAQSPTPLDTAVRNGLDLRDAQLIQSLNPQPGCLSSWTTLAAWLRHGLTAGPERPSVGSGPLLERDRWVALNSNGDINPQEARPACVRDRWTDLVWAVGLEGDHPVKRHPHSPGAASVGALIATANAKQWCGHSDWSLPSRMQLMSLTNYQQSRLTTFPPHLGVTPRGADGSLLTATAVQGARGGGPQFWIFNPGQGYTYIQSLTYTPDNSGLGAMAMLVSHDACRWAGRVYRK
jgi:hypothetical protein